MLSPAQSPTHDHALSANFGSLSREIITPPQKSKYKAGCRKRGDRLDCTRQREFGECLRFGVGSTPGAFWLQGGRWCSVLDDIVWGRDIGSRGARGGGGRPAGGWLVGRAQRRVDALLKPALSQSIPDWLQRAASPTLSQLAENINLQI